MPVAKASKRNAASELTFITFSHPDQVLERGTQTIIRSKALSSVSRAKKKKLPRHVVLDLEMLQNQPATSCTDLTESVYELEVVQLCRALGLQVVPPALPHLGIFAVEPDYRARELLFFMSNEAKHVYRPFRTEWFNMAILSSTSYYLCLANAAVFLNQHATGSNTLEYTDSIESTRYYSKCLTQVNKQLTSPANDIDEGTITTILGFICHSLATHNYEKCEMHMHGLERIISLRGGFHGLGDLLTLFASWFDITNAVFHDTEPRLPCPPMLDEHSSQLEPLPRDLAPLLWGLRGENWDPYPWVVSPWAMSMTKMHQLAAHINSSFTQQQFWEAGIKSTTMLGPVAHCILSIPRLDITRYSSEDNIDPTCLLRESTRLALLVVMALLKRGFSLIADELHSLLDKLSTIAPLLAAISCSPGLRLWVHLVHACALEQPLSESALADICFTMRGLDISSGRQAFCEAEKVTWIHCLLYERAKSVEEQIDHYFTASQHVS